MKAKRDYGSFFIDDAELEQIFGVFDQKAEELGGHCLVFDNFECTRCGSGDGRLGLDLRVPTKKGAQFLNEKGRPLVMINVRLCEDCIRWTTADGAHESQFLNKVLSGLQWDPEGDRGEEDKCGIVTPAFKSLLSR